VPSALTSRSASDQKFPHMPDRAPIPTQPAMFLTTRWTLLMQVRDEDGGQAERALEALCARYWKPALHFVKGAGVEHAEAEDVVQSFFVSFLGRGSFGKADASRGRFRSYFLGALRLHLADHWRRASAQKRGNGQRALPLECAAEVADADSHGAQERAFDRQWAMSLLAAAAEDLRQEMHAAGRSEISSVLEPLVAGGGTQSYAEAAEKLGVTVQRVATWLHRMRQRRAELIRMRVAETLDDAAELEDELRHLLNVVA
jgi:RNA polymerase sigma factor (sigma-70 family)